MLVNLSNTVGMLLKAGSVTHFDHPITVNWGSMGGDGTYDISKMQMEEGAKLVFSPTLTKSQV